MGTKFKTIKDKTKLRHIVLSTFVALAAGFSAYMILSSRAADVPEVKWSVELPANEASGLVASRQYPGVMWWHRDGGTATAAAPRNAIYAVKFDANGALQPVRGSEKTPFYTVTGDSNSQWEDIALDSNNNLWIGEIGSNDCKSAQYIYKIAEPNPASTATLAIQEKYSLKFPDPASGCTTKNAEAMMWFDDKLYIISKENESNIYRVDFPASGTQLKLVKLGKFGTSNISFMSVSDDRKRMMIGGQWNFRVYVSGNTALQGDAYIKDILGRSPKWIARFQPGAGNKNGTSEGGSFVRNSHAIAFVAESKEIYYAKPAGYGDDNSPTPAPTPPPPSTPAPTPTPPTSGCTVNEKLVNTCRPWLGAAANRYSTAQENNYQEQILAHEKAIGRQIDFAHTYHTFGSNTLSSWDKYFINRADTYLFTNWKPAKKWSDAAGGNSSVNANIDKMADSIKSVAPKKIMLTLNHEAENDVTGGADGCSASTYKSDATGGTPADYRAMWENIRKRFDARGATNVVWAIDYMNFNRWDCLIDDLYPGNHLVDWVVFNAYGYGTGGQSNVKGNIQRFVDLLNKYQSSSRDFNSKAWAIAEWNVHDMPATTSYKYYDDMKAIANNNTFPQLKGFFVFDSIGPEGNDNRIAYVDGKYDSTRLQHYKDLANSNIFKSDTAPTPTPDTTPPSAPTNLRSTAQSTSSVSLAWTASSDNKGVTGYRVYRNGTEIAKVTQTTFTGTGLMANTSYSYTIDAYDAAGNSSARTSPLVVATNKATDTTAPSAPSGVNAQATTATNVVVSWSAANDDVGVTSYLIQRNDITIAQINGDGRSYSDGSVLPSTNYTYKVRAVDAAGNTSVASNGSSVTTPAAPDTTAPSKPENVTANVVGNQVNLTWPAATDNIGVKDYVIYRNNNVLTNATVTNFGDATVQSGQSYTYYVVARDAAGNTSQQSNTVNAAIPSEPANVPHQHGLAATYYPNTKLEGVGVTRTDTTVDFNWRSGAPVAGIPRNNFSARWTGRVTPTNTATYTFYTRSDDGVRLWVNNKLLIDDWNTHGVKERSGSILLTKGVRYNIRLEYFEAGGDASVKLLWRSAYDSKQLVPSKQLVTSSYGLTGAYYKNKTLTSLAGRRLDSTIDFSWAGSPITGAPTDNFSGRWTGTVFADTSENYTFYTVSNDGVRLWVNDQLIIDNWTNHGSTENQGNIRLTAGSKNDIKLEYYDATGRGVIQLLWDSPSRSKQIVPENRLHDR